MTTLNNYEITSVNDRTYITLGVDQDEESLKLSNELIKSGVNELRFKSIKNGVNLSAGYISFDLANLPDASKARLFSAGKLTLCGLDNKGVVWAITLKPCGLIWAKENHE